MSNLLQRMHKLYLHFESGLLEGLKGNLCCGYEYVPVSDGMIHHLKRRMDIQ